jgi:hypothetical protein
MKPRTDVAPTPLPGRLHPLEGRRPKVVEERRICADPGCTTELNRYNGDERCYRHQVRRFPRVRGAPNR